VYDWAETGVRAVNGTTVVPAAQARRET
jgi:hypothetical protein